MPFDEKLKALRRENDMTQKYVAARLNVARSTIAGYETKNRQPSHEKLTALANLFHVSVDYLLDDGNSIELSPTPNPPGNKTEELLTRYNYLSSESKRDLFKYMDLLELRDKS